ncbi:MAG: methyl-accepting chemotaxis protein [Desulfuromonadales bacterium]|nr:methyl-accepting chemotaxis protein [Desulfuromonadales bacterium]
MSLLVRNEAVSQRQTEIEAKGSDSRNRSCGELSLRPRWDRDEWYEYLSQPGRQLVELHALTEDRFLSFGASLTDFHKRATAVSNLASSIQGKIIGDESSGGIQKLQMLIERMSIFIHDIRTISGQNERALFSICAALEQLQSPLQLFGEITRRLQIIGITTRIECSGFSDSQNNITHLSDSIRRLGRLIAGDMNEIIDQVAILYDLSKAAHCNESALNNGESARAMAVVAEARSVLEQLVTNSCRARQQSESLTKSSAAVTQSIAEIVSSIQFHDITRQQIEHVTESIEAFGQAISKNFRSGELADRESLEREIADGCRLQSEQLGNSGNELSAAVWRIIESLHSLSANVKNLASDTRELSGDTARGENNFFAAIESAIESVVTVLTDNLATAADSALAINAVVSTSAKMVHLVEEVEAFGAEMKVLALNASIESVHVKAGGSALGVIADSIQDLAREALLQSDRLSTGLIAITKSAKTLSGTNLGEVTSHDLKVATLISDSDLMLTELRQTNAQLLESFARMDQQADSLASDIFVSASSIKVHQEAGAIIDQGIAALNFIADRFDASARPGKRRGDTSLIKGIRQRYSMRSERDIHDRIVGGSKLLQEQPHPRSEKIYRDEAKEHGLGANVELF